MAGSPTKLGLMALGAAALLGGLMVLSRGKVAAGESVGPVGGDLRSQGEESAPGEPAQLVDVQGPAQGPSALVAAQDEGVRVVAGSEEVSDVASVSGILHLPRGFRPTEPIEVFASPAGRARRSAPR